MWGGHPARPDNASCIRNSLTTQTARKLKQVQKLISNSDLNPLNKPVILYAPNYKFTPAQDIIATGSYVVYSQHELLELLSILGA